MAAIWRLFSEGFRIFFLAAGVFGAGSGILWTLPLAAGGAGMDALSMAPSQWHAHEMIFGYGAAAIGGFFLTAVPNWTGTKGARVGYIAGVFALWLIGRTALWPLGVVSPMTAMVADLLFIPVLAWKIFSQLLKRPKPQNMVLLTMLVALWVSNLLMHLEWTDLTDDTARQGLLGGLMTLVGLIGVLGGRVTPAFTRNAMKRVAVPEVDWPHTPELLNKAAIATSLVLPWAAMSGVDVLLATVALIAGAVHLARLSGWKSLWTAGQPILWSLHIGMAFLALGLILWGLAGFGIGQEVAAIHVLGIGCVGGMTLAVMSRAALGHTGRTLIAPGPVAWAYGVMACAALIRWVGQSVLMAVYDFTLMLSGGLWVAAMVLFLIAIYPMVIAPRVDGKSA
ncbi:MAG: NnrS family protein [Shimia sp.]|uniref:NnrS family protein n=1 Tax=Shimia sp. TaxID=1954381 RepID=UPI0025E80556|nr:NnrS family protein [Shimia sp.]MCH2068153.1 NnrS family protein [Shimia sp.]